MSGRVGRRGSGQTPTSWRTALDFCEKEKRGRGERERRSCQHNLRQGQGRGVLGFAAGPGAADRQATAPPCLRLGMPRGKCGKGKIVLSPARDGEGLQRSIAMWDNYIER